MTIFECDKRACSPCPYWKQVGLTICSKCSRMMEEYSCKVSSSAMVSDLNMQIQKMCDKVPFFISCHIILYVHVLNFVMHEC